MANIIIYTELKSISAILVKTMATYTIVEELFLYNCCDSWTSFVADLGLVEISLDDQTSIEWQINQLYARPKFNQEYSSSASYGVVANSQCETLKAEYNWT